MATTSEKSKQGAPAVSVVVPVYNVRDYLPKCLDSLQHQTCTDWEAVLVDDGSTDGSAGVCDAYATADPRFRVIHQANAGVSVARNAGVEAARGTWLTFVDADDWVEPGYLEHLLQGAEETGAQAVFGGWVVDSGAVSLPPLVAEHADILKKMDSTGENLGYICSKLFLRSLLCEKGICFPEGACWAEDVMMVLEYLVHAERLALIASADYHYIDRPGSGIKKLHSLRSEYAGFKAAARLRPMLEASFPGTAISFCPTSYMLRTIYALYSDPEYKADRSKRLEFMRQLDFKKSWIRLGHGFKNSIYLMIIRLRLWRVLDWNLSR